MGASAEPKRPMRFRALGATAVIALVLAGCTSATDADTDPGQATAGTGPSGLTAPSASPDDSQSPQPTPSRTLTKRQQIIADAKAALLRWQAVTGKAYSGDHKAEKKLVLLETPTYWANVTLPLLNEDQLQKQVQQGTARWEDVQVQRINEGPGKMIVKFRACQDVSDVKVVRASGRDKGKVLSSPGDAETSLGTRAEVIITLVFDGTGRWRISNLRVPLEDGMALKC